MDGLKRTEIKIKGNMFSGVKKQGKYMSTSEVIKSWDNGTTEVIAEDINGIGLRPAQFGALSAIRAHWTVSNKDATVVMPTGTGKTETMMTAVVTERIERTLVVVPSALLRTQVYDKFKTLGILYDIGYLKDRVVPPNVLKLNSNIKNFDEFRRYIEKSNIIVTTMALLCKMQEDYKIYLSDMIDLLIVDESHHISAKTWMETKSWFLSNKIIQFTATPFRDDGKKIDGDIIYNFPLHLAQKQGYFKKIEFEPVEEFDELKSDREIAKRAVFLLQKDLRDGYEHLLLVRAKTIARAEELFDNIYNRYYSEFKPILITNRQSAKEKKERMEQLKSLESKILVCVDMFGEGIDIPNLKIAAIHDKYKSIPITLQFIGRFARTAEKLGDAKIVANIADDDIVDAIEELYEKDTDWNQLLPLKSNEYIDKELSLQKLIRGFSSEDLEDVSLSQLKPKVSMIAYRTNDKKWYCDRWINIFDESKCRYFINRDEKILIIIEPREVNIGWTSQQDIFNIEWHLYIVYWNNDKNIVFLNSTDKSKGYRLIKEIFDNEPITIKSENVFRSFSGINRLMLGTVGLNSGIDGPVRYKMFAGIDVGEGISESQKANCYKSNLFGNGYNGNGKVSIGASHKGTVWSRWVESIDYWKNWCDQTIDKINDDTINVGKLLEGVLTPKLISKLPESHPYRIDWPLDFDVNMDRRIIIDTGLYEVPIYELDIRLKSVNHKNNDIIFMVKGEQFIEEFRLSILKDNYFITSVSNMMTEIKIGNSKKQYLYEFFKEEPPTIWFADGSSLQGNILVSIPKNQIIEFPEKNIISYDWNLLGVDIRSESQLDKTTNLKKKNSIQYKVIEKLIEANKYTIIFDDDGSGEIADIVAISEEDNTITMNLFHCKFSHGDKPGSRINDLYEVCGQAEKSVSWKQKPIDLIDRMKYREVSRNKENKPSRFEIGDLHELSIIRKKIMRQKSNMNIYIVQPGVDSAKITPDMNSLLATSHSYCMDTFGIELKLICS